MPLILSGGRSPAGGRFGEGGEQVAEAPPARERELAVELDERLEREAALGEPWVRHRQPGLVHGLLPVEQEVEVDRPGAEARAGPLAPEGALDGEEPLEQITRRERRLDGDGAVQEARLVGVADGVRLAERRHCDDLDLRVGREQSDRPAKMRLAITKIAPKSDVRAHRRELRCGFVLKGSLRAFVLVVVLLALAGETHAAGGGAAPKRLPALTPAGDDALTRALQRGELTAAQYALQRALALFRPDEVRRVYGRVEAPRTRDGTPVLRDLFVRLPQLGPRERRLARGLLARPTDGRRAPGAPRYTVRARHLCGANLCLHWVARTRNAPPLVDADHDRIPDWVETTRAVFAHVWAVEVGRFGYRRPRADLGSGPHRGGNPNGKLDVFLADIGAEGMFGYCTSDDPRHYPRYRYFDRSAYCVVDDDFAATQFEGQESGLEALEVTAAHEFFHAVQFAYDVAEDLWLLEGTAVWMEDEVYDDVNGNVDFLDVSALTVPQASLDRGHGGFEYGSWLFFRFLSEYFGPEAVSDPSVIRAIWRRADASRRGPDDYSLRAIQRVVAGRGRPFRDVFAAFGLVNRSPSAWYEEGVEYPAPGATAEYLLSPAAPGSGAQAATLNHLAARYFTFRPEVNVPASAQLRVSVDLPSSAYGPRATLVVSLSPGERVQVPIPLNPFGDGAAVVPFDPATVTAVDLVLTNGSTRFRCWRGTVYSCAGRALDDGRPFAFSASLA